MKIDWEIIKDKTKGLISNELTNGEPSYSNIDEGLDLFWKTVLYKSNIQKLDGLPRVLIPSLQEALILKSGEVAPILQIATSLEPYLRKLMVLARNISFDDIKSKPLVALIKSLELNTALTNQTNGGYPQLEEENLSSFKGEKEYLEFICHARLIRNEVHNSPNWNALDAITNLKNVLVVFIYATLKYSTALKTLPRRDIIFTESAKKIDTEENKMLFDFISFGNTTTEIKTQVINAFILHYLIKNQNETIDNIKESTNQYFGKNLNSRFYERIINILVQKKQIEYSDELNKKYKLTENELKRLDRITKNFSENKELFLLYLDDIIVKYKLEDASEDILEKLKEFYEENYDIDVKEACDRGIEITQNQNSIYCDFVKYLKNITNDEKEAEGLFKELLLLCDDSDFLLRLSASKVFSKITNPDRFQNYIRLQERNVYIDTQLILHALCLNYTKNIKYENIYYRITDELFDFANQNEKVNIKISRLYLSEVIHQLKLALLLIPFEDIYSSKFSNNVFFLFYEYLKSNGLLEEHHNTFAKFLDNWLLVSEDDVYNDNFEQVAKSNLQDLLKDELNVEVVYLKRYENKEAAIFSLEKVIKDNLYTIKPPQALSNDALMVCHLSDSDSHETEPFFLTWDKTFTEFRKEYKKQFNRLSPISWHLFNPSKFLNHMSLIDFKIDSKKLTNEYLSIIDSIGIHEKTQTIYDGINKFLDLKDINKGQRRRYIKIASEIFNDEEFSYNVSLPDENLKQNITTSFADIIERINARYYGDGSSIKINEYRKAMLNEECFVKITNVIAEQIKQSINDGNITTKYLVEIDKLVEEYK